MMDGTGLGLDFNESVGDELSTSYTAAEVRTLSTAATGQLDVSFGNGGKVTTALPFGSTWGDDVAIQADGRIVVAGRNSEAKDIAIARYHIDGTLDVSFGSGGHVSTDFSGNDYAKSVAIQADGKIVVAGTSWQDVGGTRTASFALARYHVDGRLDSSFGSGGQVTTKLAGYNNLAYDMAIQADGKIVVVGMAADGDYDIFLTRYHTNGTLDSSFGSGGMVRTESWYHARGVALQTDGTIVVVGEREVARYHVDGTLDQSFGSGGMVRTGFWVTGGATQADGKIVVMGSNSFNHSGSDIRLARYRDDGTLDTSFGSDGQVTFGSSGQARDIAIQTDGKIVVVTGYRERDRDYDFSMVRYNVDGTLDPGFGSGGQVTTDFSGSAKGKSVAIQADGKIVIAGSSGWGEIALARYHGGPPGAENPNLDNDLTDQEMVFLGDRYQGTDVDADGDFDVIMAKGQQFFVVGSVDDDPMEQEVVVVDSAAPWNHRQFDLDRDGDFDLIVVKGDNVVRANVDGDAEQEIVVADSSAQSTRTGFDLDGDGDDDLIVVQGNNVVPTNLDSDDDQEIVVSNRSAQSRPSGFDLDWDGDDDLIVVQGDNVVHGNLDNDATDQDVIIVDSSATRPSFAYDLDADGDNDLTRVRGQHAFVAGSVDGDASEQEVVVVDSSAASSRGLDLDSDGDDDLIVVKGNNAVHGNLDNDATDQEVVVVESSARSIHQEDDLDGDGDIDLVVVKGANALVADSVDGDAGEQEVVVVDSSAASFYDDIDLDGDGDNDLIRVRGHDVVHGNLDNDPTDQEVIVVDSSATAVSRSYDLDTDGDKDLIRVLGQHAFVATSIDGDASEQEVVVVGRTQGGTVDLDNDGDDDLIRVKGDDVIQVNIDNDPSRAEFIVVDSSAGSTPRSYDLDGDGADELVVIRGDTTRQGNLDHDPTEQEVVVVDSSAERDHRDFDIDGDGDADLVVVKGSSLSFVAHQLDQNLDLYSDGNYFEDWGGWGEKWIRSRDGSWYFITPDGALHEWDGNSDLNGSAQVGMLDPSYHALPSKLHDAPNPLAQKAYQLDQQLGLEFGGSYYKGWGGWGEKWIHSESGTWYFITPDGALYQWNGNRNLGGSTLVETLDPSFHALPSNLHDAPDPLIENAFRLDQQLGLKFNRSYHEDWGGWGEKWIDSESGTWYFITPVGALYQWDGDADLSSSLQVEMFDPAFHTDPTKLHDALNPLLAKAHRVDQDLGLRINRSYYEDWGGWGEKWIHGESGTWYFITDDGALYEWDGNADLSSSLQIEMFDASYYADPSVLHDASNAALLLETEWNEWSHLQLLIDDDWEALNTQ